MEETKSFLAYIPALKLYAQGETEEETQRALDSAMSLYFRAAAKDDLGSLLSIFKAAGVPVFGTESPEPTDNSQYVKILQKSGFRQIADRQYQFA